MPFPAGFPAEQRNISFEWLADDRYRRIAAVLDGPGSIIASHEAPTESFGNLWKILYQHPTKQWWKPGSYGRAAYQFDGRTMPEKNPPAADIPVIVDAIRSTGRTAIKVGLPLTITPAAPSATAWLISAGVGILPAFVSSFIQS